MLAKDLFTLPESLAVFRDFFSPEVRPWTWVPQIKEALSAYDFGSETNHFDIPTGVHISGDVQIDPSVKLPPYCVIEGPCYIAADTEIRPGAYIRGNVIIGSGCVIGNACEYKNCLLMDGVQTPHYNYVGDSVLGSKAHLAAGVICANLRLDQKPVKVTADGERMDTQLRKLGALVGEGAEVACNTVLNPGMLVPKGALVHSGMRAEVRGL